MTIDKQAAEHIAQPFSIDALLPRDMAGKVEEIGIKKVNMDFLSMSALSVLAGAFIALGAIFATVALTGTSSTIPWGWSRIVGGLVFSLGLILVVVGGAELFTGNTLVIMAWSDRRFSTIKLLRSWGIVYIGNFIGASLTAIIVFLSKQYTFAGGGVGATALNIALGKVNMDFAQALILGMLCNALVCLAVWLCYSARSTVDKIAAIVFPITAFVAAGFEHSIANMYFIPIALFIKNWAPAGFWQAANLNPANYASITWGAFFVKNLIPVTLGNIIGGGLLVGVVYWVVYLRNR
ncbi:MAG: formate transporter FocA [Dehalococcoidales bacterium]|nr:formate transporter FocA [Dehalococcoidales bacterium]